MAKVLLHRTFLDYPLTEACKVDSFFSPWTINDVVGRTRQGKTVGLRIWVWSGVGPLVRIIDLKLKLSLTWMVWQSITLLPSDWTREKDI